MGLLDPQLDPMTLGLLQASAGLLAPRRQGGGLAGGIAGFGQGLLQGEELLRARAAQANRDRLTNAQIANFESESDYRKAMSAKAQAEAKRQAQKDADAAQFWQMLTMGGGMGAPTPANAARLGQPMQLTPQIAALAAQRGIDLDTLQKVAGAGDWGRSKVARTVEVRGPDGRPRTIQLDEFGRPVGEGYNKPYEMKMQDTGGSVVPVDPYAPTALTKTQTPDGRASNALGWANNALTKRGQDMTDARARDDAGRPVFSQEHGAFFYRPNAQNPTGSFVVPTGPSGERPPMKPVDLAKVETDLRKELADLPQTKKFVQAVPAYKAIADASGRDTKQADINLVYGLAKLYDPDSVVREGEYDTIANSQTIPEWLKGTAASLAGSGGRLTPATRAQILTEARGRLKTYESEYTAAKESYSRIATQRGANPENVVVPIGTDIGRAPPPSGAGGWTIQRR